MKRIFSLLIVAVLLCSLAISTSAEVVKYSYNGVVMPFVPPQATSVFNHRYFYIFLDSNGYNLLTTSVVMDAKKDVNGVDKAYFASDGTYQLWHYNDDRDEWISYGGGVSAGHTDIGVSIPLSEGYFNGVNLSRLFWANYSVLYHYDDVGVGKLFFEGDSAYSLNSGIEEPDGILGWLYAIWDGIISLPGDILGLIKDIFIPDYDVIDAKFNEFLEELKMKFSFDTEFFENVLSSEQPVTDIEGDYHISGVGDFHLTFFDTKFFVDGVTFFRPFIRGFIILLLAFYNIKMLLGFIRQDAGVVSGTLNPEDGKKKE